METIKTTLLKVFEFLKLSQLYNPAVIDTVVKNWATRNDLR